MNNVKTLREEIVDALNEATIMELALSNFCINHLLETAQKLSLAPFSFVRDVYAEQQKKLKSVLI
jgi:hypothetical protein